MTSPVRVTDVRAESLYRGVAIKLNREATLANGTHT